MRSLLLLAACVSSDAFFSMGGFSLRGSDAEGQPVEEQNEIVEDEPGVFRAMGIAVSAAFNLLMLEYYGILLSGIFNKTHQHPAMI